MATIARRRRAIHPITHYWGLVKDLDDSQKLQLITMLAESVKPTEAKKKSWMHVTMLASGVTKSTWMPTNW